MSVSYRAVGWTRHKKIYDTLLVAGILLYLGVFLAVGLLLDPEATPETQLIRAAGTGAFLLLHLILSIGPLARLDRRFLPLLYNRRHLGVAMFLLALVHAGVSLVQFHALGALHPLVSVLVSNPRYDSLAWFPFQPLGLAALAILFLMAATSHDFWLANLTAPVWKTLHMLVYVAWALVVLHVALGALQSETAPAYAFLLGVGVLWVAGLHLVAGWRERILDRPVEAEAGAPTATGGFIDVLVASSIPEGRARIVTLAGERIAVFRFEGKIFAVSNVCQHQNGPLGEGKIVDGCITCPWHGYQYRPEDGCSPPPFTEKVPTFRVRVEGDRVLVDPQPLPAGTRVEPALLPPAGAPGAASVRDQDGEGDELYVGYLPRAPEGVARFVRPVVAGLMVVAVALAALLATAQAPADEGDFEFGHPREVTGTLTLEPVPALFVERGLAPGEALLVGEGKHGAGPALEPLDGQRVRLRGTLVASPLGRMLEVVAGTAEPIGAGRPGAVSRELGHHALAGEIVDAKCHLGVMKPGRGKVHRACAALCLRGGVPAMLLVETPSGERLGLVLVDEAGEEGLGPALVDFVAEPVEIAGLVERRGTQLFLHTSPSEVTRLTPRRRGGESGVLAGVLPSAP